MKVPFRIIWWAVLVLVLLPMAWLIYNALTGGLGANPIEAINRYLGDRSEERRVGKECV